MAAASAAAPALAANAPARSAACIAPVKSPAAARAAPKRSSERGSSNANCPARRSARRTASAGLRRSRRGMGGEDPRQRAERRRQSRFDPKCVPECGDRFGRPVGAVERRAQGGLHAGGIPAQFRRGRERVHGAREVARLKQRLAQFVVGVRSVGPLGRRLPEELQCLLDSLSIPEQRSGLQAGFVVGAAVQRFPQQRLRLGPGAAYVEQLGETGAKTGPFRGRVLFGHPAPVELLEPREFPAAGSRGRGRRVPGERIQ